MQQTTIDLNGIWAVRPASFDCRDEVGYATISTAQDGWLPAQVPGEIHLDLIHAGQMPEPSVGANAPQCRWPETKSWWYRTSFATDEHFLAHDRRQLVFDGLDLSAQVFINGRLIGEAANAFAPAVFELKDCLQVGQNELVVRLTAGSELAMDDTLPGQGQQARVPSAAAGGAIPNPMGDDDLYRHRTWAGKKWLRKPQFTYGWDWVDALPNIGIWRGVHLEGRSHAALDDLRLDTVIRGEQVQLKMEAIVENLHPWSERRCLLRLEIQPPDGQPVIIRQYDLDLIPGRQPVCDCIDIAHPQLWWPNGMGEQPLYGVTACLLTPDGAVCDQRAFHIGLRTIAIDRTRLPEGSRFCIRVNGQEVFCRGGNIGPHDMIPARLSDAKYEALVAEARNANMNMLRINGCSLYESPAFYDACDRMGILLWHDFMLTCTTYPEDAAFIAAVCTETEAAVKLLRHHAAIALWCGNNECTWGFRDWWNSDKAQPLELGGWQLYNQYLPEISRRLDPHRPYWVSSPSGGEEPNSELAGDCHWWWPFFMHSDMNRRIRHEVFDECRSRFVSEYGVIGPCHLESIREYLAAEEMQPDSLAWRMHTNTFEQQTVPAAIRRHYADPELLSVPEYVLYGQMFQALIHGHAMEALRFRKHDARDDCQGALIWSYSDCWGETGWSILDYYLRRKASYYWFRRACAPVKVIVRQREDRLMTRVVNDTLAAVPVTVEAGWWHLDGTTREVTTHTLTLAPNSMQEITATPAETERDPRQWIYAAVLHDAGGHPCDQSIWTLVPQRELLVPAPEIRINAVGENECEVCSPVYCHAVHVEDHGRELLSDNWFDLLPGVPVRLRAVAGTPISALRFEAVAALVSASESNTVSG